MKRIDKKAREETKRERLLRLKVKKGRLTTMLSEVVRQAERRAKGNR